MTKLRLREPSDVACRVLANALRGALKDYEQRYLSRDFWYRVSDGPAEIVRPYVLQVLQGQVPATARHVLDELAPSKSANREKVEVGVVTVIHEELDATKIAFGILRDHEDRRVHGYRFWRTKIPTSRGKDLRVVVTMVCESRNLPCALACERLFSAYDVDTCVLVGIAAGIPDKVGLGDVITAKSIIDYEGARLEPGAKKIRPQQYQLDPVISRDLMFFRPRDEWHTHFFNALRQLSKSYEIPNLEPEWRPKYHNGVILAGEKLIADDSLKDLRLQFHQEMLALEMEGSGFARACREAGIPWLVFRGISDFGDPMKPTLGVWKVTAALSAATALVSFLKRDYRTDSF